MVVKNQFLWLTVFLSLFFIIGVGVIAWGAINHSKRNEPYPYDIYISQNFRLDYGWGGTSTVSGKLSNKNLEHDIVIEELKILVKMDKNTSEDEIDRSTFGFVSIYNIKIEAGQTYNVVKSFSNTVFNPEPTGNWSGWTERAEITYAVIGGSQLKIAYSKTGEIYDGRGGVAVVMIVVGSIFAAIGLIGLGINFNKNRKNIANKIK